MISRTKSEVVVCKFTDRDDDYMAEHLNFVIKEMEEDALIPLKDIKHTMIEWDHCRIIDTFILIFQTNQ